MLAFDDWAADHEVVRPSSDRLRGCSGALVIVGRRPRQPYARSHDQQAFLPGELADPAWVVVWCRDDAVAAARDRSFYPYTDQLLDRAQIAEIAQPILIDTGQDRDGKDLQSRATPPLHRGFHDLIVAMHGDKADASFCHPHESLLHGLADVEH